MARGDLLGMLGRLEIVFEDIDRMVDDSLGALGRNDYEYVENEWEDFMDVVEGSLRDEVYYGSLRDGIYDGGWGKDVQRYYETLVRACKDYYRYLISGGPSEVSEKMLERYTVPVWDSIEDLKRAVHRG